MLYGVAYLDLACSSRHRNPKTSRIGRGSKRTLRHTTSYHFFHRLLLCPWSSDFIHGVPASTIWSFESVHATVLLVHGVRKAVRNILWSSMEFAKHDCLVDSTQSESFYPSPVHSTLPPCSTILLFVPRANRTCTPSSIAQRNS
jgi:hypothetical protein